METGHSLDQSIALNKYSLPSENQKQRLQPIDTLRIEDNKWWNDEGG